MVKPNPYHALDASTYLNDPALVTELSHEDADRLLIKFMALRKKLELGEARPFCQQTGMNRVRIYVVDHEWRRTIDMVLPLLITATAVHHMFTGEYVNRKTLGGRFD